MPTTGVIEVTYVYLLRPDEITDVPEHTCMATGCGYAPSHYRPGNLLGNDVWAACALVTDQPPVTTDTEDGPRLILGPQHVEWVTLCGNHSGKGCLDRFGTRKMLCVPFDYPNDD
jgi:hypothetical protein